ncbi:hypothetical protein SUDANB96_04315 [Streptomyces sp. enrichment culture]
MKGRLSWGTEYADGGRAVPALRKPVSEVGHTRPRAV